MRILSFSCEGKCSDDSDPKKKNPKNADSTPDGTIPNPDGTIPNPDGTIPNRDGTIPETPDGTIQKESRWLDS